MHPTIISLKIFRVDLNPIVKEKLLREKIIQNVKHI